MHEEDDVFEKKWGSLHDLRLAGLLVSKVARERQTKRYLSSFAFTWLKWVKGRREREDRMKAKDSNTKTMTKTTSTTTRGWNGNWRRRRQTSVMRRFVLALVCSRFTRTYERNEKHARIFVVDIAHVTLTHRESWTRDNVLQFLHGCRTKSRTSHLFQKSKRYQVVIPESSQLQFIIIIIFYQDFTTFTTPVFSATYLVSKIYRRAQSKSKRIFLLLWYPCEAS